MKYLNKNWAKFWTMLAFLLWMAGCGTTRVINPESRGGNTAPAPAPEPEEEAELSALKIAGRFKRYYVVNTAAALDLSGLLVFSLYEDGVYRKVAPADYSLDSSAVDLTAAGSYMVTVNYETTQAVFPIIVSAKAVRSIEVVKAPNKVAYHLGELFNTAGLKLKVIYNDGEVVEKNFDDSGASIDALPANVAVGTYVLNITLGDRAKAQQSVQMLPAKLTDLEATPKKTLTYIKGNDIDKNDLKVVGTYSNSATQNISDYFIVGYNKTQVGPQSPYIHADGVNSDPFSVTVEEPEIEYVTLYISELKYYDNYYHHNYDVGFHIHNVEGELEVIGKNGNYVPVSINARAVTPNLESIRHMGASYYGGGNPSVEVASGSLSSQDQYLEEYYGNGSNINPFAGAGVNNNDIEGGSSVGAGWKSNGIIDEFDEIYGYRGFYQIYNNETNEYEHQVREASIMEGNYTSPNIIEYIYKIPKDEAICVKYAASTENNGAGVFSDEYYWETMKDICSYRLLKEDSAQAIEGWNKRNFAEYINMDKNVTLNILTNY